MIATAITVDTGTLALALASLVVGVLGMVGAILYASLGRRTGRDANELAETAQRFTQMEALYEAVRGELVATRNAYEGRVRDLEGRVRTLEMQLAEEREEKHGLRRLLDLRSRQVLGLGGTLEIVRHVLVTGDAACATEMQDVVTTMAAQGYRADTCDLARLLDTMEQAPADILLLMLPPEQYGLIEIVRRSGLELVANCTIVVLGTTDDTLARQSAINHGASAYLAAPWTGVRLHTHISRAVRQTP